MPLVSTYTDVKGFDCSHYQADPVQFHEAQAASFDFCFIKATEGLGVDPTFANRQPRVRAVFPVRGFYHFVRGDVDATEQGQHIANIVGPLQTNEYIVLDLEEGCGLSGETGINYVLAMFAATGYSQSQTMIYLSDGWANDTFGDSLSALTIFHLWDARYSSAIGSTSPWPSALVWQSEEAGTVPGIAAGTVDIDYWLDGRWPSNGVTA